MDMDENEELWHWASKLDVGIDFELQGVMDWTKKMNMILSIFDEEFLLVGSCMDGSKVSSHENKGDVDILQVSNKIILSEQLFEYMLQCPAFLRIRADGIHSELFKDTTLIDNVYVPASALKNMQGHYFIAHRTIGFHNTIQEKNDKRFVNVSQESEVGVELVQLNAEDVKSRGIKEIGVSAGSETFCFGVLKLLHRFINLTTKDIDISQSSDGYSNKSSTSENILTVALSDLLDHLENKHSEYNTAGEGSNHQQNDTAQLPCNFFSLDRPGTEYCMQSVAHSLTNNTQENSFPYRCTGRNSNHDVGDTFDFIKLKSVDLVPAFRFNGWPRAANEWIIRKRAWPSSDIIEHILGVGCQVIAKRPPDNICKNEAASFRLSFACCEQVLSNQMCEVQKTCWRILKAFQKAYLKTEPRVLTSYCWKNTMFWICEETNTTFWTKEKLLHAVEYSLDFIIRCLQKRQIPLYFVRDTNLIEGCHNTAIDEVLQMIQIIRSQPAEYLRHFIECPPEPQQHRFVQDELKKLLSLHHKIENLHKIIDDLLQTFPWFSSVTKQTIITSVGKFVKCCKVKINQNEYEDCDMSIDKVRSISNEMLNYVENVLLIIEDENVQQWEISKNTLVLISKSLLELLGSSMDSSSKLKANSRDSRNTHLEDSENMTKQTEADRADSFDGVRKELVDQYLAMLKSCIDNEVNTASHEMMSNNLIQIAGSSLMVCARQCEVYAMENETHMQSSESVKILSDLLRQMTAVFPRSFSKFNDESFVDKIKNIFKNVLRKTDRAVPSPHVKENSQSKRPLDATKSNLSKTTMEIELD